MSRAANHASMATMATSATPNRAIIPSRRARIDPRKAACCRFAETGVMGSCLFRSIVIVGMDFPVNGRGTLKFRFSRDGYVRALTGMARLPKGQPRIRRIDEAAVETAPVGGVATNAATPRSANRPLVEGDLGGANS